MPQASDDILLTAPGDVAEVHDVQVSAADNAVFDTVFDAYREQRLHLPALPEVALRVREAVEDERVDVADISRLLQADPVLAARLVRVANSPVYRGEHAVRSLRAAVCRLGLTATRKLVVALAVQQLFSSEFRTGQAMLSQLYADATRVAASCCLIAEALPEGDGEAAMLAGLVYDIGAVPIIVYAERHAALFSSPSVLAASIDRLGGMVGNWVLTEWGFDDEFAALPLLAGDWWRESGEGLDLADLLNVALLLDGPLRLTHPDWPQLSETPLADKLAAAGWQADRMHTLSEDAVRLLAAHPLFGATSQ